MEFKNTFKFSNNDIKKCMVLLRKGVWVWVWVHGWLGKG